MIWLHLIKTEKLHAGPLLLNKNYQAQAKSKDYEQMVGTTTWPQHHRTFVPFLVCARFLGKLSHISIKNLWNKQVKYRWETIWLWELFEPNNQSQFQVECVALCWLTYRTLTIAITKNNKPLHLWLWPSPIKNPSQPLQPCYAYCSQNPLL